VRHRLGVGGEVRGELDLTTRLGAGTTVIVEGVSKLFEGTREDTTHLAGSEDFFVEIPPDQLVTDTILIFNSDPAAGDRVFTDLRLTNLDALAEVARRGGVPLTARHSGKVLDVAEASMEPGAPVIQVSRSRSAESAVPHRNRTCGPGACGGCPQRPDARCSRFDDGAPLVQFPFHGGDNQLFRIEPTNGDLVFVAAHSGKVLDVAGVFTKSGAPVTQFSRNFQANQQWFF